MRILELKVVDLDDRYERSFWDRVNADPLEHYFFIYDKKLNPGDTRVLLALDGDRIEGMMLNYKQELFQARGSREAVDALLDRLDIEKAEVSVPMDCKDLLTKRYSAPREYEIVQMHLEKGNESLVKGREIVRLREEHAEEVAGLLRGASPDWWGDMKTEDVRKSLGISVWLAVMAGGRVASTGCTRLLDFGSNIGIVATHRDFRNGGFATAVVSALVEEIFRKYDKALIHVLSDNEPAKHVYEKVGFRPYRTYFQIRGGMRR